MHPYWVFFCEAETYGIINVNFYQTEKLMTARFTFMSIEFVNSILIREYPYATFECSLGHDLCVLGEWSGWERATDNITKLKR